MTVPTSNNREEYEGNGAATAFDYAFKVFRADDLVAVLTASDGTETTLTRGTDYSVDGVGDEAGGTVTYPLSGDPLATGETLTLLREVPVVQETDLRNQGRYYPETLEDEFDRSRMIDQQQQDKLDRTLGRTRASEFFDAQGRRIANVGDATEDQDAYTKGQADARFASDVITKTGGHWDAKGLRLDKLADAQSDEQAVNRRTMESYVEQIESGPDLTFSNVANMQANENLYIGQHVRTLGYYTPGDGGGNDYEIVAGATGTADGGSFINLDNGLLAKGLFLGTVSSLQWGEATKTFYVATDGIDSNNGAASSPFLTISGAVSFLQEFGPYISGSFEFSCSAGTYNEEVNFSGIYSELPVVVRGPDVLGHPNVPTCVISGLGIESGDAFRVSRYTEIRVVDVKVDGFTSGNAINNANLSRVSLDNFHTTNTRTAVANLHSAFISVKGGIWDGNNIPSSVGYKSFYNATHDFTQNSNNSATDALVIKNFDRGMLFNEGVQGHIDNVNILDCTIGINNKRGAGAVNSKTVKIDGCGVGVLNENNAWFDNGIVYGATSANTVNVRNLGSSPELIYLTASNTSKNLRVVEQGNAASHTGSTSATDLFTTKIAPEWGIKEGGDIAEFIIYGNCSLSADCVLSVIIDNGSSLVLVANVDVKAGATSFKAAFTIRHTNASDTRAIGESVSDAGVDAFYKETQFLSLSAGEFVYTLRAQLGVSSDSIRFASIFYKNTYGG